MAKILFGIATFFLGVIILGIVVAIIGADKILEVFFEFSPWGLIPLILLTFIGNLISVIKWRYILLVRGFKVGIIAMFKVWLIGYALGYITPVVYIGGELFRGFILKEKYAVPWRASLASIVIDKISESVVWISIIFVGAIMFLTQPEASDFSKIISASILGMLFLVAAVMLIYVFIMRRTRIIYKFILKPLRLEKAKGLNLVYEVEKDFLDFFTARNRRHLIWVFNVSIVKYIILWLRNVFLIYYLIGMFSPGGGIMALGFLYFSYTLPIPAALGAQEAILSAVFSGVGLDASLGAVFSFLLRAAELLMVGFGIYYLMRWGFSKASLKLLKLLKKYAYI